MDIFNKSEDEILFALIAKDNPNLNPPLTPQNCYISSAQQNTDSDKDQYNTTAIVIPRYNSGMSGKTAIKYNRIDLNDLFRGLQPVKVSGNTENMDYATRAELPVLIGETYGLPIREGDIDPSSSAYFHAKPHAEAGKGVYKIANNKCFIGQCYIDFSYDFSQSLATLLKPGKFDCLNLPVGIGPVGEEYDWPSTWGYFADFDFTEIAANVNHGNDITYEQATQIGLFTGRTFFTPPGGQYIPEDHYDQTNPFGWFSTWARHVEMGTTAKLKVQFPWIDTNYTHVKITKLSVNPKDGKPMEVDRYFALYFNWYEAR